MKHLFLFLALPLMAHAEQPCVQQDISFKDLVLNHKDWKSAVDKNTARSVPALRLSENVDLLLESQGDRNIMSIGWTNTQISKKNCNMSLEVEVATSAVDRKKAVGLKKGLLMSYKDSTVKFEADDNVNFSSITMTNHKGVRVHISASAQCSALAVSSFLRSNSIRFEAFSEKGAPECNTVEISRQEESSDEFLAIQDLPRAEKEDDPAQYPKTETNIQNRAL